MPLIQNKVVKLTQTQQDVIDKLRSGAALTSTTGIGSHGGAYIQFPGQTAETVAVATVRALYRKEAIKRVKDGYHSTWLLNL